MYAFRELERHDRERLEEAYMTYAQWHREHITGCSSALASLLRAFPNLDTVRIDLDRVPKHLGGWLQAGDTELLQISTQVVSTITTGEGSLRGKITKPFSAIATGNNSAKKNTTISDMMKGSNFTMRVLLSQTA
jgi:hypothetical protein